MSLFKDISRQGLWKNNVALVQLLGLCPLLAVSSTFTNGLGLGIATMLVLIGSNATVAAFRHWMPKEIRIPIFVLIIASFVTVIQLLMNAYAYTLYQSLGIFIPLIVTNCAIIGRAEAFASKNSIGASVLDGLMMGLGFAAVLVAIGAIREILGQGTLFYGIEHLLGDWASFLTITIYHFDRQFLLAILPPGAFLTLGVLIALKNIIDDRTKIPAAEKSVTRIRVTTVDDSK